MARGRPGEDRKSRISTSTAASAANAFTPTSANAAAPRTPCTTATVTSSPVPNRPGARFRTAETTTSTPHPTKKRANSTAPMRDDRATMSGSRPASDICWFCTIMAKNQLSHATPAASANIANARTKPTVLRTTGPTHFR